MRQPEVPRFPRRPPRSLLARSRLTAAAVAAAAVLTAPAFPGGLPLPGGSTTARAEAASDEPLRYPLEGTRWRLEGYRDDDAIALVAPEVVARLTLSEGRARAGVGCGAIRAAYSLAGPPSDPGASASPEIVAGTSPEIVAGASPGPGPSQAPGDAEPGAPLTFDAIEHGRRACPVPAAAVGEALVEGLAASSRHLIEPGSEAWQAVLRLRDAGGRDVLTFRVDDASSVASGQWLLPATGSDAAVLSFDPRSEGRRSRGRVLGSTGCNSLSAAYTLEGSLLRLRGLETSDLVCAASGAALEAAVLAVLEAPSLVVELPPSRLVIRDPLGGDVLEYVSERPLEGQTWVLTHLPGHDIGALTVTLRLEAGVVSGEGPCGPLEGSYRTNGVLISISDLRPGRVDCPDRRSERAFLRALREAVFVDARGPELHLRDETGRSLGTLRRPGAL